MDELERRRRRNDDILRRLKQGDKLMSSPESTWFPPRPSIKKDPLLVASVYCRDGHNYDDKDSNRCKTCGLLQNEAKPDLRIIE